MQAGTGAGAEYDILIIGRASKTLGLPWAIETSKPM